MGKCKCNEERLSSAHEVVKLSQKFRGGCNLGATKTDQIQADPDTSLPHRVQSEVLQCQHINSTCDHSARELQLIGATADTCCQATEPREGNRPSQSGGLTSTVDKPLYRKSSRSI
eukprot:3913490-Amphidinium_carterae.1